MKDGEKPTAHKQAYALQYNPAEQAPKVVAAGRGYLAEKILDKAREFNIPTHVDAALADELAKVDVGGSIPPELYEVVAQVLVFIGNLDRYKLEEQAAKRLRS
ncbi:MAG: EscU/YscU/HrcU family type III secretion system export apparatus switch protein [Defluviitaleaceae bacterium]|nr:EscU/YscU/HrcU family type III secretion system export apparatus switch protein [Defluviitaleaceae bacterium]